MEAAVDPGRHYHITHAYKNKQTVFYATYIVGQLDVLEGSNRTCIT